MHKIYIVLAVCAAAGIIAAVLYTSAQRDAELSAMSECVARTAAYNGYTGNVHSQEAWQLFVSECN